MGRGYDSKEKAVKEDYLLNKMHHHLVTTLGPGEALNEISLVQLNGMAKIAGGVSNGQQLNLFR